MKKAFCLITAFLLIITCFAVKAEAFDGNDYEYGEGGDDYGDGGWDWRDWSYEGGGRRREDNHFEGATSTFAILYGLFTLSVIVLLIIARRREDRMKAAKKQDGTVILPDRTEQIESIIKQGEPDFTASDFMDFAKEAYINAEKTRAVISVAYLTSYVKRADFESVAVYLEAHKLDKRDAAAERVRMKFARVGAAEWRLIGYASVNENTVDEEIINN